MGPKTIARSSRVESGKARSDNQEIKKTVDKPIVRASSLNKLPQCSGYLSLAPKLNTSNKYTDSGTLGHYWFEQYMLHAGDIDLATKKFFKKSKEYMELADTPEEILSFCMGSVDTLRAILKQESYTGFEAELELSREYADFILMGHCDLFGKCGDGTGFVIDYKFYRDPGMLPAIEEDMQMAAYALMAARKNKLESVNVYRFLPRQCTYDLINYSSDYLSLADQAIMDIGSKAVGSKDIFTTGDHCTRCLARKSCPAFLGTAKSIESGLASYRGGDLVSKEQVLSVIKAIPAAKTIVEQAEEAVKKWVMENGPLVDPATGKQYCLSSYQRESIVNNEAVLKELCGLIGTDKVIRRLSSSKKMIEDLLSDEKVPRNIIENILNKLRKSGAIASQPAKRWGWK